MSVSYQHTTQALKRALKARKITYRTLADWLGLSESGVKKLLNAEDGSFGRIARICDAVGISMATVLADAEAAPKEAVQWTPQPLRFFEENPAHWYFLWELTERDYNVKEVQEAYGLDDASTDRYINDLEALGCVRRAPDGRVLDPQPHRAGWKLTTTLGQRVLWPVQQGLLEHTRSRFRAPDRAHSDIDLLSMSRPMLRPESARELRQTLMDTIREFGRRAGREEELYPDQDGVELGVMIVLAPFSLPDAVHIPQHTSTPLQTQSP